MIFYANTNHNKARVSTFMSDKADFRTRNTARDKITNDERVKTIKKT